MTVGALRCALFAALVSFAAACGGDSSSTDHSNRGPGDGGLAAIDGRAMPSDAPSAPTDASAPADARPPPPPPHAQPMHDRGPLAATKVLLGVNRHLNHLCRPP